MKPKNMPALKLVTLVLCCMSGLASAGTHTVGPPCQPGEAGRGGTIFEHSRHQNTNFIVHITDLNGDDLFTVPLAGQNVPGDGSVATYIQPAGVAGVCDAWNETVLPNQTGGGGNGGVGASSGLFFEAFLLDPNTNQYVMHDVFDTFPTLGYTRFPDFYMDQDGNGIADNGSILYSLINLATFNPIPSFDFGDAIQIVNGQAPGFDILFSTTRPVFDPTNGWTGTAYTGAAVVETDHTVSEPASLAMSLGALGFLLLTKKRARRHGASPT